MPTARAADLMSAVYAAGTAIGAFNVICLEHAEAIVTGAEAAHLPVILQVSENTVAYHSGRLDPISLACLSLAETATVPVAVHLDHATSEDLCLRAIALGYSSVMHMGYCFLGLACLSTIGTGGVVLLMVAHGLSVALLFLLATSIHHRTHTFDLSEMGGLAQKTPVLAAFFVAATMASIGLPGFGNFWGELTVFVALWNFSHGLTAVAVAGVVISAIYGLRAAARVFFGPATEPLSRVLAQHPPADLDWREKLPALLLLAALLFFGFYPKAISQPVDQALAGPVAAAQIIPPR